MPSCGAPGQHPGGKGLGVFRWVEFLFVTSFFHVFFVEGGGGLGARNRRTPHTRARF